MDSKIIYRQELYNLVWSQPVSKIIDHYAISQTDFRNLCKDHDIPLPKNGYWSKLRHNVHVEMIELPNPSDNYKISISDSSNLSVQSPQAKLNQLTKELRRDTSLNFAVANSLLKPDPIIVAAKKGMSDYMKNRHFHKGGIISTLENQVSISVAKDNITRALRFMDALVKLVKKRGHVISVEGTTKIIINKQEIEVRFREIMKREQHPDYSWVTKIPSGILSFRIDSHNCKEWRDSEKRPLETRLVDILAKLELVSVEMEEYQLELEKGWEEQRIRREAEQAIKKKREKEISDFKSLINSSGRWYKSQNLRNYLDVFEAKAKENGTLDSNKMQWLKWARKKADWYDPFIEYDDELFRGIDRDSI